MLENIANSTGVRYDRLVYMQPEGYSQWLDPIFDIERGVQIGVAGISAGIALEKSFGSCPDFVADSACLACVLRIDINHKATPLNNLVFFQNYLIVRNFDIYCYSAQNSYNHVRQVLNISVAVFQYAQLLPPTNGVGILEVN